MKTTWNIIRKETSKLNNECNINSIRINDQVVYNQITIANELNSYFSNIAGNISNKRINENKGQIRYEIYSYNLISHTNT